MILSSLLKGKYAKTRLFLPYSTFIFIVDIVSFVIGVIIKYNCFEADLITKLTICNYTIRL